MIKIMAVGKINHKFIEEGIKYYTKQIPYSMEIVELKDESSEKSIDIESKRILAKIKSTDYVVLCAISGNMFDSVEFSIWIDEKMTYQSGDIVFIIGGSNGVNASIDERANEKISFSKMTFPHQLMRLILIEQIYRGFMIKRGHPYHK